MKLRSLSKFTPKVHIPQDTWDDMMHITDLVGKEVGWFTRVTRHDEQFVLHEVHLPSQQSSGATVEFEPEHLEAYLMEVLETRPEDFAELNTSLRAWHHSHVNMSTSPSGQDQKTIEELVQNCDFFVAVRVNKKREVEADVAFGDRGLVFEDVPVTVGEVDMDRRKFWEEAVKLRVQPITYSKGGKGKATAKSAKAVGTSKVVSTSYEDYDWEARWTEKDWGRSAEYGIPASVIALHRKLTNLKEEEQALAYASWWAAVSTLWPETYNDYEKAEDDAKSAILELLSEASQNALSVADRWDVEQLMKYYVFDNFHELIEAGWTPTFGWLRTLEKYKAELARQEVLDR